MVRNECVCACKCSLDIWMTKKTIDLKEFIFSQLLQLNDEILLMCARGLTLLLSATDGAHDSHFNLFTITRHWMMAVLLCVRVIFNRLHSVFERSSCDLFHLKINTIPPPPTHTQIHTSTSNTHISQRLFCFSVWASSSPVPFPYDCVYSHFFFTHKLFCHPKLGLFLRLISSFINLVVLLPSDCYHPLKLPRVTR